MAGLYDSIDLDWSFRGDLYIDEKGDIQDTRSDLLRSLQNEVMTIVNSSKGDWLLYPTLGASLDEMIGEPNTKATARAIEQKIVTQLTTIGIVRASDLQVKVVPITIHRVAILVTISCMRTTGNGLAQDQITSRLLFDFSEHGTVDLTERRA
jgi:hypothetical protein